MEVISDVIDEEEEEEEYDEYEDSGTTSMASSSNATLGKQSTIESVTSCSLTDDFNNNDKITLGRTGDTNSEPTVTLTLRKPSSAVTYADKIPRNLDQLQRICTIGQLFRIVTFTERLGSAEAQRWPHLH